MAGRAIVSTDGAAKGNPGPAGIGVVITDESGKVLKEIGEYIGEATNNFAEYTALIRGLCEALDLGFVDAIVHTDSELMVRQISGRYQVKSDGLIPLHESALTLLGKFKSASVNHVPRAQNKAADKLASAAAMQGVQPELLEEKAEKPLRAVKSKTKSQQGRSMIERITVQTSARTQLIDVTREIQDAVTRIGVSDGVCTVFVLHTTAAITVNETADAYVLRDMIDILNGLVPQLGTYRHAQGNADAHAKASMIGCSESILVENGKLLLSGYQGVYFCEFDGPRPREVLVRVG